MRGLIFQVSFLIVAVVDFSQICILIFEIFRFYSSLLLNN